MEEKRRLIWDQQALNNLEKSLKWISKESFKRAEEVEKAILEMLEKVRVHPERHPPDKYKLNNTGDYRAFETHSFRISYRHTGNDIQILAFRHVKQYPKEY